MYHINMMTIEDVKVHIPPEVRRLKLLAKTSRTQSDDFKHCHKKMIDLSLEHKLINLWISTLMNIFILDKDPVKIILMTNTLLR